MTSDLLTWVVAVVQVVTAAGIAAFWLTWFRETHAEPWLPRGYAEHERVFVFPDTIVATLLVVSAGLAVFEEPAARTLGLICAGMLLFLGVIDAAYFAENKMFTREHGGLNNLGVVASVLLVAAILVVTYH